MLKFKFVGGPLDGLEAAEDSADPAVRKHYLTALNFTEGTVGKGWASTTNELQEILASTTDAKERIKRIDEIMRHQYIATNKEVQGEYDVVTITYSVKE